MSNGVMGPPLSRAGGGGVGGFLSGLSATINPWMPLISGIGNLFGGMRQGQILAEGRDDILSLPGMDPLSISGSFGTAGPTGGSIAPGFLGVQNAANTLAPGLMAGGLFELNPDLQAAMSGINFSQSLGGVQSALGQQAQGSFVPGAIDGLMQGSSDLFGNASARLAAGLQDPTGQMAGLFSSGAANQAASVDQAALQQMQLDTMRAAARPEFDRQFNRLQDRLFATGMSGSTGGAEQLRGLFEAQNQADLGFQDAAFGRALGQQQFLGNLGTQQTGLGAGLFGQNLGQMNQSFMDALAAGNFGAGLEGQGFSQNLQALQQNQGAALQNLAAQQGLFGFGQDVFNQNVNLGFGAGNLGLGFGEFGLTSAMAPFNIQASLLGAGGQHADALARIAEARSNASGGFFGGLFG